MPELPDVTVYVERLRAIVGGQVIEGIRLGSPFLVRSFEPPLDAARNKKVRGVRRLGKRIVFELDFVRPFERTEKGWIFEFSIQQGF